jgi:hypothetical protein
MSNELLNQCFSITLQSFRDNQPPLLWRRQIEKLLAQTTSRSQSSSSIVVAGESDCNAYSLCKPYVVEALFRVLDDSHGALSGALIANTELALATSFACIDTFCALLLQKISTGHDVVRYLSMIERCVLAHLSNVPVRSSDESSTPSTIGQRYLQRYESLVKLTSALSELIASAEVNGAKTKKRKSDERAHCGDAASSARRLLTMIANDKRCCRIVTIGNTLNPGKTDGIVHCDTHAASASVALQHKLGMLTGLPDSAASTSSPADSWRPSLLAFLFEHHAVLAVSFTNKPLRLHLAQKIRRTFLTCKCNAQQFFCFASELLVDRLRGAAHAAVIAAAFDFAEALLIAAHSCQLLPELRSAVTSTMSLQNHAVDADVRLTLLSALSSVAASNVVLSTSHAALRALVDAGAALNAPLDTSVIDQLVEALRDNGSFNDLCNRDATAGAKVALAMLTCVARDGVDRDRLARALMQALQGAGRVDNSGSGGAVLLETLFVRCDPEAVPLAMLRLASRAPVLVAVLVHVADAFGNATTNNAVAHRRFGHALSLLYRVCAEWFIGAGDAAPVFDADESLTLETLLKTSASPALAEHMSLRQWALRTSMRTTYWVPQPTADDTFTAQCSQAVESSTS